MKGKMASKKELGKDCKMLEEASKAVEQASEILESNPNALAKDLWWQEKTNLREKFLTITHNTNNLWADKLAQQRKKSNPK